MPINIDEKIENADWPKRTKDVTANPPKPFKRDADGNIIVEDEPKPKGEGDAER